VKHFAGEKNLIASVKENACLFKFDVQDCYFSPRLSNERQMISEKIKMKDRVLVMFAGVGVYPIVIYKYKKPVEIVGVELGRSCCKWFKENLKLNRIPSGAVQIIQGDVKKKVNSKLGKFDVIVMPRPNLKDSFLESALSVAKKGTRIFYNGFCNISEIKELTKDLVKEAVGFGRKIKIVKVVRAGDIAPYKFRYRVEIKVLD
jgi:tRNA G37 N-methylase Trm5